MRAISTENILYMAGFIDADGSIVAQIVPRADYVHKYQVKVTVQVTQKKKRRHILVEFQDIVGAGIIRDREDVSDYVLTEPRIVCSFLERLAPHLRLKKTQAELVIRIIQRLPSVKGNPTVFLEICRDADRVASFNDSKSRTNTAESVEEQFRSLGLI